MASGFVYIWYDRLKKRFYVGSHWGPEDDGYVCSSNWMKKAYKKRRGDFKRRILARVDTTRNDLLIEEQRWLDMIKPEEVGKGRASRYYNLRLKTAGWWTDDEKRRSVGEKISASPLRAKRIGEANRGRKFPFKRRPYQNDRRMPEACSFEGRKHTDETRAKISLSKLGKPGRKPSLETRAKMSASRMGRAFSEETRAKISAAKRKK